MGDPVKDTVVAKRLGVSPGTLRAWRYQGKGPPFLRFEGAVRYDPEKVEEWVAQQNPPQAADDLQSAQEP